MKHLTRLATILIAFASLASHAATIEQIGPQNRDPMLGKETDWIDGDYVIRNDKIVAVIARPGPYRDANMTVRGVGACLIDLTRIDVQSDQLSCFYPTAGRYRFIDDQRVEYGQTDDGGVYWRCKSFGAVADNDSEATVEYILKDGQSFITVNIRVQGSDLTDVTATDAVRADRTFRFGALEDTSIGFCEDEHFRQTYGFHCVGGDVMPTWTSDRLRLIKYGEAALNRDDKAVAWTTRVYPAGSPLDLWGLTQEAAPQTVQVLDAKGDQPRIKLSVVEGPTGPVKLPAVWRSAADGVSVVHLPPGSYRVRAEAIGHAPSEQMLQVGSSPAKHELRLGAATTVIGNVTDQLGGEIPCKVSFYGTTTTAGYATPDPNFGLDSQSGSVGNCVYTADGQFERSIPPGAYDVLISRGPEYDAVFEKIQIVAGQSVELSAKLEQVVDTTGWVSAEMHSHSSPSGDNTSDQLGRVENLVCEHLEFAPCTEHQRIESYDDQLEILGATRFMATCSGMELTGGPLPINHQNAFPLKWDQFAQGGGGPRTDSDPVAQIARLAMWDDNSEKVVQSNHPNLRQMVHDRNLDGVEDGGFSKMLDYMDVIEVHPPADIFVSREKMAQREDADRSRMLPWMDLLKSGRRIPGVVNTDAHYNWNGSGWLRNWIRCSTDDPAEIRTEEMIDRLQKGQIVMSTGPFMTVQLHHPDLDQPAEVGDDVEVGSGPAELAIKVQCPNWLDINRVEVFIDGEIHPELSRRRSTHPDAFGNEVVKFDQRLSVELPQRCFVIVAAIGERMELGRVMGSFGNRPPVAVSNPIYVSRK